MITAYVGGMFFGASVVFLAICLTAYFACFSVGYGPVVWVYCFEILPNRNRGKLSGMSLLPGNVLEFCLVFSGPMLYEAGRYIPYAVLAATNLMALIFFYVFCADTKG